MKKRYIVLIVIAVLVAALFIWRLWPQPASLFLPDGETAVTNIFATATVISYEHGADFIYYNYDNDQPSADTVSEILDILKTSDYQPDLRNLLPWGGSSLSGGNSYDGRSVTLYLRTGNGPEDVFSFHFVSRGNAFISVNDGSGSRIYHPTNPEILSALVEYIQTHGKQE